jgi:hypothetical protein
MNKHINIRYKKQFIIDSLNINKKTEDHILSFFNSIKNDLISSGFDLNTFVFEINNYKIKAKNRKIKHQNKYLTLHYGYFTDYEGYDFITQYPIKTGSVITRKIYKFLEYYFDEKVFIKESLYFIVELKNITNISINTQDAVFLSNELNKLNYEDALLNLKLIFDFNDIILESLLPKLNNLSEILTIKYKLFLINNLISVNYINNYSLKAVVQNVNYNVHELETIIKTIPKNPDYLDVGYMDRKLLYIFQQGFFNEIFEHEIYRSLKDLFKEYPTTFEFINKFIKLKNF